MHYVHCFYYTLYTHYINNCFNFIDSHLQLHLIMISYLIKSKTTYLVAHALPRHRLRQINRPLLYCLPQSDPVPWHSFVLCPFQTWSVTWLVKIQSEYWLTSTDNTCLMMINQCMTLHALNIWERSKMRVLPCL